MNDTTTAAVSKPSIKLVKEPTKFERFQTTEYYQRVSGIMLKYGMGEGDVEMILGNLFNAGEIAATPPEAP